MSHSNKKLVIKLGGACNLNCKHCHSAKSSYQLNDDIFKYIEDEGFWKITFCGGEPLLYIDDIKKIVERLPSDMAYRITTNGTLLTKELVKYFNDHNFNVIFSYDGEFNDSRDDSYIQCWHEFSEIEKQGIAILYSQDNSDVVKLFNDVVNLKKKYKLHGQESSVWINFVHQTKNNDEYIDQNLIQQYCLFLAGQIELDMRKYKADPNRTDITALVASFIHWMKKHVGRGYKCFNDNLIIMSLDGNFLLCPYDTITVGNIYTGVDWDKIESFIPKRCRECPQWESCGNTCLANVTDNECYISKVMHRHMVKLMNKYSITYENIEEKCIELNNMLKTKINIEP